MSLFVTGTDTDVGKTVVSTILALKFGWAYWKPVQCGVEPGTDSQWVGERLGAEHVHREGYVLQHPLSPHAAARLANVTVDVDRLQDLRPTAPAIIEGAGGALVPLNDKVLFADWIARLQEPCVVVSRSRLGTINHTLLTLEALRARGVEPLGVIMTGELNPGNAEAIREFGRVPVLGQIPVLSSLDRASLLAAQNYLAKDALWN